MLMYVLHISTSSCRGSTAEGSRSLYHVESCRALYQICTTCCIACIDSSVSDLSYADVCVPAVSPGEKFLFFPVGLASLDLWSLLYTCSWNMGRRSNHLSLSLTHAAIHAFCTALHNRHLEVARLLSLSLLQFCSKLGVRLSACAWPPRTWSAPVLRSRSSSCLPSRRQQQLRRRLSVGTARPLAS
jgi:hypothetical protein